VLRVAVRGADVSPPGWWDGRKGGRPGWAPRGAGQAGHGAGPSGVDRRAVEGGRAGRVGGRGGPVSGGCCGARAADVDGDDGRALLGGTV